MTESRTGSMGILKKLHDRKQEKIEGEVAFMRGRKRILAGLFAGLLCLVSVMGILPGRAYGAENIDMSRGVSLAVHCRGDEGVAVPGVRFRLYRVADVSPSCTYTLTSDFAASSVVLNGSLDSARWKALATTLSGYVGLHRVTPAQEGISDANGVVMFPQSGTMEVGLYLVTGDHYELDGENYFPMPFLVCLPNYLEEQWVYENVAATPKYTKRPKDESVNRRVLKTWDNKGGRFQPREIQAALLRDGQEYERVTLSEANGWGYQWNNLDGNYDWQLAEVSVPENYTVLVDQAGMVFHVVNTYEPPGTPPPGGGNPGGGGGNPGGGSPNVPTTTITEGDVPFAAFTPDPLVMLEDEEVPLAMLPQTGMLWWPVPILTICGLVLFMMGWGEYRRYEGAGE